MRWHVKLPDRSVLEIRTYGLRPLEDAAPVKGTMVCVLTAYHRKHPPFA